MERLQARFLGERPGLDPGRDLAPLSVQAVPRFQLTDGVITEVADSSEDMWVYRDTTENRTYATFRLVANADIWRLCEASVGCTGIVNV